MTLRTLKNKIDEKIDFRKDKYLYHGNLNYYRSRDIIVKAHKILPNFHTWNLFIELQDLEIMTLKEKLELYLEEVKIKRIHNAK